MNWLDLVVVLENYYLVKLLHLFDENNVKHWMICCITLILTSEAIILDWFQIDEVTQIFVPIFTLLIYTYIYNKKILQNLSKIVMVFLNLTILKIIIIICSVLIMKIDFNIIINNYEVMYLLTLISIIAIGIEYHLLKFYLKKSLYISKNTTTILCVFLVIIFYAMNIVLKEYAFNHISLIFCLFLFFSFVICLVCLIMLIIYNSSYYERILKQSLIIESQQYESKYVNMINDKIKSINKLNHDYNNHLKVLKRMIKESHLDEANNYLNILSDEEETNLLHFDHLVFNYLINIKKEEAEEKGISIHYIVVGEPVTYISDVDYSILIGNLLDNAIEGTVSSSQKEVNVLFSFNDEKTIIEVKNPTVLIEEKKFYKSFKNDNHIHGLGLENIKNVLKRYDGFDMINIENNIFIHKCILYKKEVTINE